MNIPRKLLKTILSLLSRWAISKHKMEIIVVAGFTGSEVVKEGIYQILKEKFNVRRNTAQISWDMSIPLAVLGYKDKRRNILEWLSLIIRATGALIFNRSNPHTLVLNANCTFADTAKFWSSFLSPDYLVALSGPEESEMIKNILKKLNSKKSLLIYDNAKFDKKYINQFKVKKAVSFGEKGTKAALEYDTKGRRMLYKGKEVKIPTITPLFTYSFIAGVFLTAINHRMSFEEVSIEAIKFDLGIFLIKRIKQNIERSD